MRTHTINTSLCAAAKIDEQGEKKQQNLRFLVIRLVLRIPGEKLLIYKIVKTEKTENQKFIRVDRKMYSERVGTHEKKEKYFRICDRW